MLFVSLLSIMVIFSLAVVGIYAGKGPAWAFSTDYLSAATTAAGVAQINAIQQSGWFWNDLYCWLSQRGNRQLQCRNDSLAALAAAGAVATLLLARGPRHTAPQRI